MKSRFIHLFSVSVFSVPLLIISPLVGAAKYTRDDHVVEENLLLGREKEAGAELLFLEEAPFHEWELDKRSSLTIIHQQLKAKEFEAALENVQQLRKKQQESPDLLTLEGLAYSGIGKKKQAEAAFKNALTMDPGNPNAATYLARMALQTGDFDGAHEYYQQILKYHPNHQPTLLKQEKLSTRKQFQVQDFDAALKTAQQLSKKYPDQPDPLTLMGIAYAGKGDKDKARTAFEQAIKIAPGNPNAAINLAILAYKGGHFDEARGYFLQVLEYHPNHQRTLLMLAELETKQGNKAAALAHFQVAVQQHPKVMKPLVALARFQLNTGDVQQALATLNKVPQQYANHPLLLETLGEAQLSSGDYTGAQSTLQKWLTLQPKSARAQYLVGAAYLANKDRIAAKAALFKGLELNPNLLSASELMTLMVSSEPQLKEKDKLVQELKKVQSEHPQVMDLEAQLALLHDDAPKAVDIYKKLQQRYPDSFVWVKALARAQWKAGETKNFLTTLNTWLQKHPDDTNIRYMQAFAYMQLNRENEAKVALTQVVKHAPDYVPALNNLAWLLRDDNPQQALTYAQRAHQLSPNNPAVMDTLGVVLLQQGKKTKALELLNQAQALNPNNNTMVYHYAMALAENGKPEQARKILSDILNQQFSERKQAQALYKSL